jgi:adenylate cyclase
MHNDKLKLKELELQTLLEITNSLLEFENVQELLQEILDRVCSILDASSGFILTEEKTSDLFVPRASFNIDDQVLQSIIFNKKRGFLSKLKNTSSGDNEFQIDPAILKKLEKEFYLVAPLFNKKSIFGAIFLLDKEQRVGKSEFTQNDKSMLAAISAQASVAYNNTSLLDNLIESQRFNNSVLESIQTGVITTNLFGEIDLVNQAALDLLNTDRDQIISNHYEIVFESCPLLIDILQQVESNSISTKESNFIIYFSEREFTVNLAVSPLIDPAKGSIGLVIAMEDVSNLDKLKSTFKKYVSKQIVDQILESEDSLNLGGQELEVTTLFSDIRGFTSMSEKMDPIDVVASLNEYFDKMIEVVFKYNGTLDKIIGDALMVIYGAPIGSLDDPERALLTAIEMQQKLSELNVQRIQRGQDPLEIGIGINTGKVVSGNIGSKEQMNYTVIGDAVNLSARLCSYAKAGQIIISENTYKLLKKNPEFAFRELEPIQVKGKSNSILVYDVKYFKNEIMFSPEDKFHQIEKFLLSNLPDHLTYHNLEHIRDVVEKVQLHGLNEKLDDHQLYLLKTAAWLHDIGYIWDESNHEQRGIKFALSFLPTWGFSTSDIDSICGMILATKIPQSPKNLMEQVICDADLDYLGRDDYFQISRRLFTEINHSKSLSEEEWKGIQIKFFENHQYFTDSANSIRNKVKSENFLSIETK